MVAVLIDAFACNIFVKDVPTTDSAAVLTAALDCVVLVYTVGTLTEVLATASFT